MSKTALRRHQQQRHMRRRLATPRWSWVESSPYLSDVDRAALRNRASRHTVPCSCPMCGHARERKGLTVQELRAADVEDWTNEDFYAGALVLMGQMYERDEQ